jgi:hypothetical protein
LIALPAGLLLPSSGGEPISLPIPTERRSETTYRLAGLGQIVEDVLMNEGAIAIPSAPEGAGILKIAGLASRVLNLGWGEGLTLVGIAREELGDALRARPQGRRSALLLEDAGARSADAIFDGLLDDLAALAGC